MTRAPRFPCPADACARVFRSEVALRFHLAGEHPGGVDAYRGDVRRAQRAQREAQQANRDLAARKLLDHLYAGGCACGNSLAWHRQQRTAVAVAGGA